MVDGRVDVGHEFVRLLLLCAKVPFHIIQLFAELDLVPTLTNLHAIEGELAYVLLACDTDWVSLPASRKLGIHRVWRIVLAGA